ncbi:MAG: biopolymer transporter ExbD [Verrucomicrobiota bacterium]
MTLSEINITPLLDLAFVLLIIFIITTPLLERSIRLNLPAGGRNEQQKPTKNDIRTLEIAPNGQYRLRGQTMPLQQIETELAQAYRANPNLIIYIRADENGPYKHVASVLDMCERRGITRLSLRTQPDRH